MTKFKLQSTKFLIVQSNNSTVPSTAFIAASQRAVEPVCAIGQSSVQSRHRFCKGDARNVGGGAALL